jgi:hypothetical protein
VSIGRGHVEYLRTDALPLASFALAPTATGLRGTTLSRDPGSGAASTYVVASPLWRWDEPHALSADVEVLVFDGDLRLAGADLRAGDYAWIGAGTPLRVVESARGAAFLWMPAGEVTPAPERAANTIVRHVPSMPWVRPPSFEGRSAEATGPGLDVKFLREDPTSGAYTLLSRHVPGWSDPRLEAHDTWEELLLLEGDYLMGASGVVTAGTYIFRPGARPHGPQASRYGAVWFCRGERRIDFQFTQPAWTDAHVAAYFALPHDDAPAAILGRWY